MSLKILHRRRILKVVVEEVQYMVFPSNNETEVEPRRTPSVVYLTDVRNTDGSAITDANAVNLITLKENDINGADIPFTTSFENNAITIYPDDSFGFSNTVYLAFADVQKVSDSSTISGSSVTFSTKAETIVANPIETTADNVFYLDAKQSINGVDPDTLAHDTVVTSFDDNLGVNNFVPGSGSTLMKKFETTDSNLFTAFWVGDINEKRIYLNNTYLELTNQALFNEEATFFFVLNNVAKHIGSYGIVYAGSVPSYSDLGTKRATILSGASSTQGLRMTTSTSSHDSGYIVQGDDFLEGQVFTVVKRQGEIEYRLNGNLISTKSGSQLLDDVMHYLGAHGGNAARIMMNVATAFSRALTTTEVNDIENYLVNRFHTGLIPTLKGTVDTTSASFLFFNIYKASEFPSITTDKPYFVIYANDHGPISGTTVGLFWGDCDDRDLTNFTERGLINVPNAQNYQAETPYLIEEPDDPNGKPLRIYWHTGDTDPENVPEGIQNTRLAISAGGGYLHNLVWEDKGNPLTKQTDESHLGYLTPYRISSMNFKAYHAIGGDESPLAGKIGVSTSTDGGITYTREKYLNSFTGIPAGWRVDLNYGKVFDYNGKTYSITHRVAVGDQDISKNASKIALFRINADESVSWIRDLFPYVIRRMSVSIENDVAKIYFTRPRNKLFIETFNLSDI